MNDNALPSVYQVLDEKLLEVRRSHASVYEVCKRGCSACCEVNWVACTSQEWGLIYDELVTWEIERQTSLVKRTNGLLVEFYAKPGMREAVDRAADTHGPLAFRILKDVMDDLGMPCPFLVGDGSCSIYEVRPTICRVYGFAVVDQKQLLVCSALKSRFEEAQKNGHLVKLPFYNQFRVPVLQLDGEPLVVMALPMWVERFNTGGRIADINGVMPEYHAKWNQAVFV